jgi:GNAT superfamily N-acetyltransferase
LLRVETLIDDTLDEAGSLIAAEQNVARSMNGGVAEDFTDPRRCRAELAALLAQGHVGVTALDGDRLVGVLCGEVRGIHARLRAEGLAVDPRLRDPTAVLVAMYATLAPKLIAAGAIHHHPTHVNLGPLSAGLNNLGFGRSGVYATRATRPRTPSPRLDIRVGTAEDLQAIASLSNLEMAFRFTPPIYALPHPSTREHVAEYHRKRLVEGAIHLLARAGRDDVGLITLEFTSPSPRLCAGDQPYIGPTATHSASRGQGVGRELVEAAADWAYRHDFPSISVDFDSANPLSRPFWFGAGFAPTGYQLTRSIDPSYRPTGTNGEREG